MTLFALTTVHFCTNKAELQIRNAVYRMFPCRLYWGRTEMVE